MLRSKLRGIIHHNYELVMNYRKLAIRAKGLVVQKKYNLHKHLRIQVVAV